MHRGCSIYFDIYICGADPRNERCVTGVMVTVAVSRRLESPRIVADIDEDPDDAAIVRAIVALGRSLDLKVVAVGVTTTAQLKSLSPPSQPCCYGRPANASLRAAAQVMKAA